MNDDAKVRFFDGIADKWDGFEDIAVLAGRLKAGLETFRVGPFEQVLDIGCGTGNLTRALLDRLSGQGRVVAVDSSAAMVALARAKIADARVDWHITDAASLPVGDGWADRALCFSAWPHFDDPGLVAAELRRALRPGGRAHIWHLCSRETINAIHASAGPAVAGDVLAPAAKTARLLEAAGLTPYEIVDDDSRYLVSACKPERAR